MVTHNTRSKAIKQFERHIAKDKFSRNDRIMSAVCPQFQLTCVRPNSCSVLMPSLRLLPLESWNLLWTYLVYSGWSQKNVFSVPWRTVWPRTDQAIFWPKRSIHPTIRLLWQFTTVTFRLKVDGLSVHPKLWHSDPVNSDGLSQCDKPSHCNILSQSLWHFVCVFIIQLCSDILS